MRKQKEKLRKKFHCCCNEKNKYLGIYLPKETKDLYIENYKTHRGEHRQNTLRHKSQQDPL